MVKSKCSGLRRGLCVVVVALAGAGLAAPAVSAQTGPGGYGDVAEGAYYSEAVALLDEHGVFDGTVCGRGFCPDDVVDRNTMAVWLVRVLDGADPSLSDYRLIDVAELKAILEAPMWPLASGELLAFDDWMEQILAGAEPLLSVGLEGFRWRGFLWWSTSLGFDEWLEQIREGAEPLSLFNTGFGDVDYSGFHAAFVEHLRELGVTAGCGDGTDFCGDRGVTRAQMAVFLSRAFELDDGPDPGFGDVASDAWYASDVARLAASGITSGCGDGTDFCPDRPTTRAQMATFLARAAALLRVIEPPSPPRRPVIFEATEDIELGLRGNGGALGVLYSVGDGSREQVAQQVWQPVAVGCDIVCPLLDAIVWSPDNQWFMYRTVGAFHEDGSPAQVAWFVGDATNPADGDHVKLIDTTWVASEPPAAWSPDGSRVAYDDDRALFVVDADGVGRVTYDGDRALFVVDADGANPAKVADDVYRYGMPYAWSPDGSRVAYVDGDGALFVVDADGANPAQVADDVYRYGMPYAWSPDGSRVAYVDGDGALFVVDADGANPAQVADDVHGNGANGSYAWSPDGSRVAYIDDDGVLFVVDADGANPAQVADDVHGNGANGSYAWSPDGSRVAYIDDDGVLFVVDADGASPVKVADDVYRFRTRPFVWSPDGSRVAYIDDDGVLFVVDADGASPVKVADDVYRFRTRPFVWSPDGSRVAYIDDDGVLFVVDADGASPVKVADDVDGGSRSFVWSPDGSRIAYVTIGEAEGSDDADPVLVGVVGIDGGEPVLLRTGFAVRVGGAPWWVSVFSWHWNGIAIEVGQL